MATRTRPSGARGADSGTAQPARAPDDAKSGATAAPRDPRPEQRPWLTPEDARGWKVVARGRGRPRPVSVSVLVDFNHEQSAWLREESRRTGLDYTELVKKFVDEARAAHAEPQASQQKQRVESAESIEGSQISAEPARRQSPGQGREGA